MVVESTKLAVIVPAFTKEYEDCLELESLNGALLFIFAALECFIGEVHLNNNICVE